MQQSRSPRGHGQYAWLRRVESTPPVASKPARERCELCERETVCTERYEMIVCGSCERGYLP